MDDTLKATLTDAERQHAAALFDAESADVKSSVLALFTDLNDPLLATDDVVALLGAESKKADIAAALDELVGEKNLDVSSKTQRPFDTEGTRLFRRASSDSGVLKLLALESLDHSGRRRFLFTIDGRLIRCFARIDRLNALDDTGNQRDEIRRHVEKIAEGIGSGTQVPSPVLLVLLDEATAILDGDEDGADPIPHSFIKVRPYSDISEWVEVEHDDEPVQRVRLSILEIPYRRAAFDDEKSILLVDGQQRTAALSLVPIDSIPSVEMAATAVIADAEDAKRVFQVANDTVKISTDFSRALLASMGEPPGYLKSEKIRADACKILALTDNSSPFYKIVKHPGAKVSKPPIAYNSLFAVVGVFSDGLPDDLLGDAEKLAYVVRRSFHEIQKVWPEAWGLKPTDSRLTHGAGLRAMAALAVSKLSSFLENGREREDDDTWVLFSQSLERLRTRVVWTAAASAEGTSKIKQNYRNEIATRQNTMQDIQALSDFLRKESLDLDIKASKGTKTVKTD